MINNIFSVLERIRLAGLTKRSWRPLLEGRRRILGLFSKAQLCVFGRLSKEHCIASIHIWRQINRIRRKSGPMFLAKYIKAVQLRLMWYVGGDKDQFPGSSVFVSTTRSGIPRFFPPNYRRRLKKGNCPALVRYLNSILTLYRLILIKPKGSLVKPDTIMIPGYRMGLRAWGVVLDIRKKARTLLDLYTRSGFKNIPLQLGFRFKPVWASGPNTYLKPSLDMKSTVKELGSRRLSIWHTLGSVLFLNRTVYASEGPVVPDENGKLLFHTLCRRLTRLYLKDFQGHMRTRPEMGRFGTKMEPAGKVRVFAIGSPLLQSLLRPLHDWCMSVLKLLPTDGTYNQTAPLLRLRGKQKLFSFDLKAATDSLPVDISIALLIERFGEDLAQAWHMIMNGTTFRVHDPKCMKFFRGYVYRFTKGQPLGYSSSWPVFTLTHHALVWLAASRVRPGRVFLDYAILGDDIVIADELVAQEYLKIIDDCEVKISKEKSLISSNGSCEFAKRFMTNNVSEDLSPLSLKVMRTFGLFTMPSVYIDWGIDYKTSIRLRGGGYRCYSACHTLPKSAKWMRHWLCYHYVCLQRYLGGFQKSPSAFEMFLTAPT